MAFAENTEDRFTRCLRELEEAMRDHYGVKVAVCDYRIGKTATLGRGFL